MNKERRVIGYAFLVPVRTEKQNSAAIGNICLPLEA